LTKQADHYLAKLPFDADSDKLMLLTSIKLPEKREQTVKKTAHADNNPVPTTAVNRRGFLQQSALLLGSSLLVQPHLAQAQSQSPAGNHARVPANAAELDAKFFPGFETMTMDTNGVSIHTLVGGNGPPLLLLHGAPQSHFSWAEVAVNLAKDYTVVLTDLRGYGWSSKPEGGENHINYSKRTMAQDNVNVMSMLGFDQFALIGHDRGGRVARRLTLDHPERVKNLTVLDIVPAHYLYDNVTLRFVETYFHWFLFLRPAPFPENIIVSTGMFITGGGTGEIG
jgi:haloacetate dehalogenase